SPPQTQERPPGADAPQARVPVRSAAGRAPDAGPAAAAGQTAAASPAGAGQAAQAAAAPGGIASGSGSVSGASAANSGATAAGSESPAVAGYAAAAAAGAAAAGAASGAAATSIAASAKCAETSSYYGPIIQQASREMLALNGQAISCGPTIKCGFASHSYCTEPDSVPLWWKGYYESRCACARVHCKVNEKCEEINSLNCQQLHACPITAAKPCQKSPCDY
ncbi:MAG: hypothetical protein HY926_06555, partial [Elusimicrobia bacterium]|nr:hypothetical protein [Elusimicrobiota bacterium]